MATQAIPAAGFNNIDTVSPSARRPAAPSVAEHNSALFAAQSRARRGPTPEAFYPKHIDNTRLVKAADPARAREMRMFTVAMSVLFIMVMAYGLQHFRAIDSGYRIEAAKQQREHLREENRQLALTEAQRTDPQRIDQLARQLGLAAPAPGQVVRPDSPSQISTQQIVAQNAGPR